MADIVPAERLVKWMPDYWNNRIKSDVVDNGRVGQTFIHFERRADLSPTENLASISHHSI